MDIEEEGPLRAASSGSGYRPNNNRMEDKLMVNMAVAAEKTPKELKTKCILFLKEYWIELIGVFMFILGVVILSSYCSSISEVSIKKQCEEQCTDYVDYTNCQNDINMGVSCIEHWEIENEPCTCSEKLIVAIGYLKNVTLYYQLDSFDQTEPSYAISRDDMQLAGQLSDNPSANCEPYRFRDKKPIAPCGLVADSIFNDTYALTEYSDKEKKIIDVVQDGMIDEEYKKGYRNPPEDRKKDFALPLHWTDTTKQIFTNESDPENSGFQNERFIGWMNTNMTRKPVFRVNQNISYAMIQIDIGYNYPPSGYNGTRKLILCGLNCKDVLGPTINMAVVVPLIILMILGLTLALVRPIIRCWKSIESKFTIH